MFDFIRVVITAISRVAAKIPLETASRFRFKNKKNKPTKNANNAKNKTKFAVLRFEAKKTEITWFEKTFVFMNFCFVQKMIGK